MTYKFSIGLEASGVSEILMEWLFNSLPMDFTVKNRKVKGFRVVEVTINAMSNEGINDKLAALFKVIREKGFNGVVIKDMKPKKA